MYTAILKALMCVWGIFWNLLIVAAILNDQVLRRSSTFLLLTLHFLACTVDVGSRLVFDVPSEILNRPLFRLSENYDDFPTKLFHFTSYSCWFIQLYSLIAIAVSHILAVYCSFYYSRLTQKKTIIINLIIVLFSMISAFGVWSPNFPIIFYTSYWGWGEDRTKPLVQFFFFLNYVLQTIVFCCLFLADVMIIYKISSVKENLFPTSRSITVSSSVVSLNGEPVIKNRPRSLTELKVSINFIIVSLFLLIQTLIYNICSQYSDPVSMFLLFIAPIFRGSKCLAYLVSGSALRNAIKNLILCRKKI